VHHVSDTIAVRPEFSFAHSETEAFGGETSGTTFGLGVSLLYYTRTWENAAAYFSPRFAWSHGSGESRSSSGVQGSESSANSYTWAGSVGAQGWIGSRFSVFGEVGLAYTHGSSDSTSPAPEQKTKSFALRSGVGAVLYF
jgi:hypothetical protein